MASIILTAVLYLLFALCFLVFNIMQLNIEVTSDMFQAVSYKLTNIPWRVDPLGYLHHVQSPEDVYKWLQEVFVKKIYDEFPANGDDDGYCTDAFPCAIMEGQANSDDACSKYLEQGNSNCPHRMGPNSHCCRSCRGDDCEQYRLETDIGHVIMDTAESDVSAACAVQRPNWLDYTSRRLAAKAAKEDHNSEGFNVSRRLAGASHETMPELADAKFCAERIVKQRKDGKKMQTRYLTTSSYNRVLMGRISLKRQLLVPNNSSRFSYAYTDQTSVRKIVASVHSSLEDTSTFGDSVKFDYAFDDGYMSSGGYVKYLNMAVNRDVMSREIEVLYRNNAFDLRQGSMVLELMIYNGNVQKFMHMAVVFEHDFSGQTYVEVNATPFDLSLYDSEIDRNQARVALEVLIILFFLFFVKSSAEDMSDDFAGFFSNIMAFLDVTTMTLCFGCILMYCMLIFSYAFTHFEFPIPPFSDTTPHQEAFKSLEGLSQKMETLSSFIAINVCLIFIRCLSLITEVSPKWGIVINTIGQAKKNLANFILMFIVMFLSFTFAAQFLFGIILSSHATIGMSFLTTFRMLMGEGRFSDLQQGDAFMSVWFFYIFHLFFIILVNMLLSILVHAYNTEVSRLGTLSDDKDPLKRLMAMCIDLIAERFSYLNTVRMGKYLIASGTTGRINYERVNALRDQRANKPKIRNVTYKDADPEEGTKAEIPSEDVALRAEMPHYADGMMHYFVEQSLRQDGPAEVALMGSDGKFRPNEYRLISVQSGGQDPDTHQFRSQERWNEKDVSIGGYNKNVDNILKDVKPGGGGKVNLVFEGKMKMISYECIMMVFFVALVFVLLNRVARVETQFYLQTTIVDSVVAPKWKEFNPQRDMNFDSIERFSDVYQWASVAIARGLYGCTVGIDSYPWLGKGCDQTKGLEEFRSGWSLLGEPETPMKRVPASEGLSYGYVPDNPDMKVRRISRVKNWNLGVAKNNFVRMTTQRGCFTENKKKRWMFGYPQVLAAEMFKMAGCSQASCMKNVMERQEKEKEEGKNVTQCLDIYGREIDIKFQTGNFYKVNYTYTDKGSYRNLGGIVFGLGGTSAEAEQLLARSDRDGVFSGDTMSIVFDWVLYNPHIDLFAYCAVEFSLMPTGHMKKIIDIAIFPPFNGFGSEGNYLAFDNFINTILMALYFILVMLFSLNFAQDAMRQVAISTELQHDWYMTPFDFFQEDTWNYTDVISVANNFAVVLSWILYLLSADGGFDMASSFAMTYEFTEVAGPSEADRLNAFQEVADRYQMFLMFAAVNAFFITVRLMKYFVSVQQLRLILTTLGQSFGEIANMLLVVSMLLVGFVIMFHVQYGVRTKSFATITESFISLFLFMVGSFDIDTMMQNNPYFTMIAFPIYQFMFYFLLTNMFLATILARWKTCRKDAQDLSIGSQIGHLKRALTAKMSKPVAVSRADKKLPLDTHFWKSMSVLPYLARLEDSGAIRLSNKAKKKEGGGEEGDAVVEEDQKALDNMQVDKNVLQTRFKKAHMEIASQMCKKAALDGGDAAENGAPAENGAADTGGGIGALEDDPAAAAAKAAEEAAAKVKGKMPKMPGKLKGLKVGIPGGAAGGDEDLAFTIGFIDDEVETSQMEVIKKTCEDHLELEGNQAEEIWLDCLVTALEDTGVIDKLRKLYVPPRMIKPKKVGQWEEFFKKKDKLEFRMDIFLQMITLQTKEKHYEYLSEMSNAKQKVLKSQSIVLSDYLNELDKDIEKLKEECQSLDDKYVRMRKHVAPLL